MIISVYRLIEVNINPKFICNDCIFIISNCCVIWIVFRNNLTPCLKSLAAISNNQSIGTIALFYQQAFLLVLLLGANWYLHPTCSQTLIHEFTDKMKALMTRLSTKVHVGQYLRSCSFTNGYTLCLSFSAGKEQVEPIIDSFQQVITFLHF